VGRDIFYDERAYLRLVDLGYDHNRIDDRMALVEWALAGDAEAFPLIDVHGAPNLRVVRILGDGVEPTLRAFFRIDSDHALTVLWVEPVA